MMIFYLYRNKPWLGIIIYTLSYLPALNGHMEDPLALKLGGHAIGFEIFALLALPFIYIHTKSNFKMVFLPLLSGAPFRNFLNSAFYMNIAFSL